MNDFLVFKKAVDKSVLRDGMTIPVEFSEALFEKIGFRLDHGQKEKVKLSMDGVTVEVTLTNENFSRSRFAGHSDLLQIRYTRQSPIIPVLETKFAKTAALVDAYEAQNGSSRGFRVPEEEREYLYVYANPVDHSLFFDAVTEQDMLAARPALSKVDELSFETMPADSPVVTGLGLTKISHLTHALGHMLAEQYEFHCQICGQYVGVGYGSELVHTHHIDYFTRSMNNNTDNLLVVCPNHHGIIHDRNPIFHRDTKVYEYPNGYREGLKLNMHL